MGKNDSKWKSQDKHCIDKSPEEHDRNTACNSVWERHRLVASHGKSVFVRQALNHSGAGKANVPGGVEVVPFLPKDTTLE